MDVTLDLDPILGAGEIETLHRVLETEGDDGRLQEALTAISLAASEEYLEMMLGKQIPSRAQDVREHRLYLLLKRYFGNSIPSEAQIASFFQLTEAQSRSLLRNTRTKYRFDLDTALTATIQALLNTATQGRRPMGRIGSSSRRRICWRSYATLLRLKHHSLTRSRRFAAQPACTRYLQTPGM